MDLALWHYPVLFVTGFAAGLVDAVAGGGGIIALPVFLNLGLPAHLALGTNKLQASCGSVAAVLRFRSGGAFRLRTLWPAILLSFCGSLGGALVVRQLDPSILGAAIPWLLIGLIAYFALRPTIGAETTAAKMDAVVFSAVFGLALGFYDGFFGPGAGSFWIMAYVVFLGFDFSKASAHAKVVNCASNLAALLVFWISGLVDPAAGLAMGVGQVFGARTGARMVLTRGARFVRPVFLAMAALTVLRLLWKG